MNIRPILLGVLLLIVPASSLAAPLPSLSALASGGQHVPGEVLVRFAEGTTARARSAALSSRGHSLVATLGSSGWTQVRLRAGQSVEAAMAAYRNDAAVLQVQPNFLYHATTAPNDPHYGQQWGLKNTGQTITDALTQPGGTALFYTTANPGTAGDDLNLEKAWGHITDCSGAVVAVVDSGVNYTHQDLAANMWNGGAQYPKHGYNFVDGNDDPMDLNGHGTHVAGTIGAVGNNATGVSGVCWRATIMAVRVLDSGGTGSTAQIIQGITFAVEHGAKVINMSLGGGGSFDPAYSNAITTAQSADVLVVVAAGNDGKDNDGTTATYPCNFTQPNLLCVAALDQSFGLASFSNFGATSVDVGAPGTNILSTWTGTEVPPFHDSLNSGWSGSTTTGGGWDYGMPGGNACIVDPSGYPSGGYNQNTDDRAYKTFSASGLDVLTLDVLFAADIADGDHLSAACSASGGDPFAGGVLLGRVTNVATYPNLTSLSIDITPCESSTMSIGFQITSGNSSARGAAVCGLGLKGLAVDQASYNTIDGTSMATPATSGVAAMIRAYNPRYTAVDTLTAIELAGRPLTALTGKTTTGNAVDAMSSLAYIHPPTGVTVSVQ